MAVNHRKKKMAKVFSVEEAAAYLRQIADALEQGHIKFAETELDIEGAVEIKSALKSRRKGTTLKMKILFAPNEGTESVKDEAAADIPVETNGNGDLPYKKLKKRMGAGFKKIKTHLKNDRMPPPADLEPFYLDCLAMIDYPGKGDEYYPRFKKAALRMMEMARAQDPTGFTTTIEAIDQMRKDCHAEYK